MNDAKFISGCIEGILESNVSEVIVVDGGSTDGTIDLIKKFSVTLIQGYRGMMSQTMAGLKYSKSEYIFLAEADHIYPLNSINTLLDELILNCADGIQARLDYLNDDTFFERGHKNFLRIHQDEPGPRDMISGAQLWKKDKLFSLFSHIKGGENYSFDTQRTESIRNLSLNTYLGNTLIYEFGDINFSRFLRRHINYGYGDCDFYTENKDNWTVKRKIKSLTHVLNRYFISYPIKSFKYNNSFQTFFYLYLIGVVRYLSFIKACFSHKNSVSRP